MSKYKLVQYQIFTSLLVDIQVNSLEYSIHFAQDWKCKSVYYSKFPDDDCTQKHQLSATFRSRYGSKYHFNDPGRRPLDNIYARFTLNRAVDFEISTVFRRVVSVQKHVLTLQPIKMLQLSCSSYLSCNTCITFSLLRFLIYVVSTQNCNWYDFDQLCFDFT